jgi:putative glutamine amidotransferase
MPIFAICRGVQVLNVAFGGTLVQDIPTEVENALKHEQEALRQAALSHTVKLEPATRLFEMAGAAARVRVNSFHHQSVRDVADGFVVNAVAPDGVIEGIEDPNHPFCIGVQWHPERTPDDDLTRSLFQGFVSASQTAAEAGIDR